MHFLKLLIRDGIFDPRILVVTDISQYDDRLPLQDHALFIQLPGFDNAVKVPFPIGQTASYSAGLLKECGAQDVSDLPDGLYTLTYSVAPNNKVFTVSYHFRTALLEQALYQKLSEIRANPDPHIIDGHGNNISHVENTLLRALMLIDGLKFNASVNGDVVAAENAYQEVSRLLSSLNNCE